MKAILLFLLVLTSCSQSPKSKQAIVFQSSAELGWYGNIAVVNITDYRGEQYMIQYKLYRKLFSQGGYNKILSFYYNNPNDERLYVVNKSFQVSRAYDAVQMSLKFDTSYVRAMEADTMYKPKAQVISKSLSVRKQRFGDSYNPSTAKPVYP